MTRVDELIRQHLGGLIVIPTIFYRVVRFLAPLDAYRIYNALIDEEFIWTPAPPVGSDGDAFTLAYEEILAAYAPLKNAPWLRGMFAGVANAAVRERLDVSIAGVQYLLAGSPEFIKLVLLHEVPEATPAALAFAFATYFADGQLDIDSAVVDLRDIARTEVTVGAVQADGYAPLTAGEDALGDVAITPAARKQQLETRLLARARVYGPNAYRRYHPAVDIPFFNDHRRFEVHLRSKDDPHVLTLPASATDLTVIGTAESPHEKRLSITARSLDSLTLRGLRPGNLVLVLGGEQMKVSSLLLKDCVMDDSVINLMARVSPSNEISVDSLTRWGASGPVLGVDETLSLRSLTLSLSDRATFDALAPLQQATTRLTLGGDFWNYNAESDIRPNITDLTLVGNPVFLRRTMLPRNVTRLTIGPNVNYCLGPQPYVEALVCVGMTSNQVAALLINSRIDWDSLRIISKDDMDWDPLPPYVWSKGWARLIDPPSAVALGRLRLASEVAAFTNKMASLGLRAREIETALGTIRPYDGGQFREGRQASVIDWANNVVRDVLVTRANYLRETDPMGHGPYPMLHDNWPVRSATEIIDEWEMFLSELGINFPDEWDGESAEDIPLLDFLEELDPEPRPGFRITGRLSLDDKRAIISSYARGEDLFVSDSALPMSNEDADFVRGTGMTIVTDARDISRMPSGLVSVKLFRATPRGRWRWPSPAVLTIPPKMLATDVVASAHDTDAFIITEKPTLATVSEFISLAPRLRFLYFAADFVDEATVSALPADVAIQIDTDELDAYYPFWRRPPNPMLTVFYGKLRHWSKIWALQHQLLGIPEWETIRAVIARTMNTRNK